MIQRIAALVFVAVTAAGVLSDTVRVQAAPADDAIAGAVSVTINYKGKGAVDASHRVWVFVFDTPNIGPGAMPIAMDSVAKNGAVATFDVAGDKVWIAVAYDESGTMTGDGPPPSGSPIAIYGGNPTAPEAVVPGAKASVTVTFDDSQRMP
jgi:hypothetical protein